MRKEQCKQCLCFKEGERGPALSTDGTRRTWGNQKSWWRPVPRHAFLLMRRKSATLLGFGQYGFTVESEPLSMKNLNLFLCF